jgi:hypothetical protein
VRFFFFGLSPLNFSFLDTTPDMTACDYWSDGRLSVNVESIFWILTNGCGIRTVPHLWAIDVNRRGQLRKALLRPPSTSVCL